MLKIGFLFITLFLSATVSAQTISKEELAVQHTVENMFAALTHADTTALKLYCTSNVKFYEYGQIWTLDTIIQKAMQSKAIKDFKRSNKFDFVNTTTYKTTAWTTYNLQSEITRNGKLEKVHWMETVVLTKEKKRWRITLLHSTHIKRV